MLKQIRFWGHKRLQRTPAALSIATALLLLVAGVAMALTLTQADGTWSNAVGTSGPPGCLHINNTTAPQDENQIAYGAPAVGADCSAVLDFSQQSGFGFDGTDGPIVFNRGEAFLLGEFTHYNNPINDQGSSFVQADLNVNLNFSDPPINTSFQYIVQLDETPNEGACVYPGATVCPDRVFFANTIADQNFEVNETEYTLQIVGFVPGEAGTCVYNPASTINSFITEEQQTNSACLFARIVVNEPALQLEKTGPLEPVAIGDTAVYTLTVSNLGNVPLQEVTLNDPQLGINALELGTLDLVDTAVVTGTYGPVTEGDLPGPLVNTATATARTELGTEVGPVQDTFITPIVAPDLSAVKTAELADDADGNGEPSAGDTLHYEITIINNGGMMAMGTVFTDTLDNNVTLVTGSVTTTQGTVTTGNAAGDTDVLVEVGTIAPGDSATIVFDVQINDPLPPGITTISNRGIVFCVRHPRTGTEPPPSAGRPGDDTRVPIVSIPVVTAWKDVAVAEDRDGNDSASPGDTLEYTVVLANRGNVAAENVGFLDRIDPYVSLVENSLTTTQGDIISGSSSTDTTVQVAVGTMEPGASVTIVYQVRIDDNIPSDVTRITNTGIWDGGNLAPGCTTGAGGGGLCSGTPIDLLPVPGLIVHKIDTLWGDLNGDALPSPGDTILYEVTVENIGSAPATDVIMTDALDPNVAPVANSVQASRGLVTSGNAASDDTVEVQIGVVPPGEIVRISYLVGIDPALPDDIAMLTNQCRLDSNELPPIFSDDPRAPGRTDRTRTIIGARPDVQMFKTDLLVNDVGNDGDVSAGDTLLYLVVIANRGNVAATDVLFEDTLPADVELLASTLSASAGSFTADTSSTPARIVGDIGTLGPGEEVVVGFRVVVSIDSTASELVNQCTVTIGNPDVGGRNSIVSDDPDTNEGDDATRTIIVVPTSLENGNEPGPVELEHQFFLPAIEQDDSGVQAQSR